MTNSNWLFVVDDPVRGLLDDAQTLASVVNFQALLGDVSDFYCTRASRSNIATDSSFGILINC